MAEIAVVHTATVVHGIHDRLTQMGKAVESVERREEREAQEARDADAAARRARRAEAEREEFRNAVARIAEHGHDGLRQLGTGVDADASNRASESTSLRRDAFGRVLDVEDDSAHDAGGDAVSGSFTSDDAFGSDDETSTTVASASGSDAGACAIRPADADHTVRPDPPDATIRQVAAETATAPPTSTAADDADTPLSRTLDEVRADIAADLLLTGLPTAHTVCDETGKNILDAIRGSVQVTIPVAIITSSHAGADHESDGAGARPVDASAFLAGYGPIDPDTARRLAGTAPGWDRLFRDPDTGVLLTIDRYTPSEQQKRFLLARDETCRFPCCRTPVRRADADHTIDWQHGGETNVTNLATLCRAHHMVKHHTPWKVTQGPGGVLEWESPLGHTYVDVPQPTVRFTASTDTGAPGRSDPPPF